ncbi:MAG: type III pantothenate kinase [Bacteroidales bacterium]|nr:MAG: type III pantothenate kinase [Bacteroidales bacterium]
MNLIIDIGNTLTKVAITDNDNVVFNDRYEILTKEILVNLMTKYSAQRAILSVVGRKDIELINLIKAQLPTIELDHNTNLPITNHYKTPETLGLDRIAAVVGANYLYPSTNLLVIDSGTAITFDLIDSNANYLGGAISPGVSLRYKSLHQHTANLPFLTSLDNNSIIGQTTKECIESGVLNGVIGEADNYICRVKEEFPSIKVVFTGGDANFFVNKLKNSIFVVQNLVIIGLNRILDFNAKH